MMFLDRSNPINNKKTPLKRDGEDYYPINMRMKRLLKNMDVEGSLFLSCIQCNISIDEAEEWYRLGKEGKEDFVEFYNMVNLIEGHFGFNIEKRTRFEGITISVEDLEFFARHNHFIKTKPLFLQQDNKKYKVTNIFKSHDSNEIFISVDFKSSSFYTKHRDYDFCLEELTDIVKSIKNKETYIYVINLGKTYRFSHVHDERNSYGLILNIIIDFEIDDGKYEKIDIDDPFALNSIPESYLDDFIELLKRSHIIEEGFFECDFFYFKKGKALNIENREVVYRTYYEEHHYINKGIGTVKEILNMQIEVLYQNTRTPMF